MPDFNGRIDEIIRAFQEYPAGDMNTRMIVRRALAAERQEAFQAGYIEGAHDQREAHRFELQRALDAATGDSE